MTDEDLLDAWSATVEAFRDPGSPERRALDPDLIAACRLSPEGLAAGLEAVLGGVRRAPAGEMLARAARLRSERRPALVVLASNLPALAVQPLLPLLALRRPVLLKSPSAEPHFAPAFVSALARRHPALGRGIATACWPGGDERLEATVLPAVGAVLAYGDEAAVSSLECRAPGKVIAYGPKTSLAVLGKDVEPAEVAEGLARDIALFDQRGCLSIAAVYTVGDPQELAGHLAGALAALARRWPSGPAHPAELAAVQQVRLEADLRGLYRPDLPISAGTVIVEPRPDFHPTPGRRTVRVHPLDDVASLPEALSPWKGRLQGAALAGADAWGLAGALEELGLSRFAEPGDLQSPDAAWHNGGIDPLAALAS